MKPVLFEKDQQVYLTAFLKEERTTFYICKGIVQEIPNPKERQVYKVKIVAIADRAIGKQPATKQTKLLNLVCTKKVNELHTHLVDFMKPPNWIE